ncbi:MAG: ribose-phosphate diphosphokinase [Candidatus Woesearchaeota archaeon]
MEENRGQLGIIACDSGRPFAEKIIGFLEDIIKSEKARNDVKILDTQEARFANSEIKTELNESIRGHDIYIIQDVANSVTGSSIDTNLRALKTAIDAACRCDAHYVTAVLPVFPYARQDKPLVREGITAAQVAREIEDTGAERVITLDVHNEASGGFFRRAKLENLHASKNMMGYVRENIGIDDLAVLSPDPGGVRRANHYAKALGAKLGIMYKERDYSSANHVENVALLGDVKDKNVLIIDDMIDTAGTLVKNVELLKEKHGPKDIYFACSLPMFNGPAVERLRGAYDKGLLTSVIGTDAVYHGGENFLKENPWYREVSVAKYFAKVIFNINHHQSLSKLLE